MKNNIKAPKEWAKTTLGSIANYINGRAFKPAEWKTSGAPIIRIQNLNKPDAPLNYTKGVFEEKYLVKTGDLLYAWSASLGVYIWSGGDAWLNQHIFKVLPHDGVNKKFLYYLLEKITSELYAKAHGSGMVHVTKGVFEGTEVYLPDFQTQTEIVQVLDELFSNIDGSISSLEKSKEGLKLYRLSLLNKAFLGELTSKWRKEAPNLVEAGSSLELIKTERNQFFQDSTKAKQIESVRFTPKKPKKYTNTDLLAEVKDKMLPAGWVWAHIGDICEVGTGVTPLKSSKEFYENGEIPWVTSGALNNLFVSDASEYVTQIALEKTGLKLFPKHTLLVAMYGEGKTRGKCSELLFEATTNQAIACLVQNGTSEKYRRYLKWFLIKNYSEIRLKSSGGVQPNLNLGIIENTLFPFCSIDEANEIASELDAKFSVIDQLEILLQTSLEKAMTLRKSILERALSGGLNY